MQNKINNLDTLKAHTKTADFHSLDQLKNDSGFMEHIDNNSRLELLHELKDIFNKFKDIIGNKKEFMQLLDKLAGSEPLNIHDMTILSRILELIKNNQNVIIDISDFISDAKQQLLESMSIISGDSFNTLNTIGNILNIDTNIVNKVLFPTNSCNGSSIVQVNSSDIMVTLTLLVNLSVISKQSGDEIHAQNSANELHINQDFNNFLNLTNKIITQVDKRHTSGCNKHDLHMILMDKDSAININDISKHIKITLDNYRNITPQQLAALFQEKIFSLNAKIEQLKQNKSQQFKKLLPYPLNSVDAIEFKNSDILKENVSRVETFLKS